MKNTMVMTLALALCGALGCGESKSEPAPQQAEQTEQVEAEQAEQPEEAAEETEAAPEVATVGAPAPDFTLTDQAGTEHSLSQHRGKIVVLEWINPECPYVQRHYQSKTMTTLAKSFADQNVVWLAIDSSASVKPEASEAWRQEHEIAYPILQDPEGTVGRLYAARTTPHMYVIDAEGTLRYAGGIDDDPRGRSESPTNYVDGALRALTAGEDVPTQTSEPYGCTVKYEGVQ